MVRMAVRLDAVWKERMGLLGEEWVDMGIDEVEHAIRQEMGNNRKRTKQQSESSNASPTSLARVT